MRQKIMNLIKQEIFNRIVEDGEEYSFDIIEDGLYLIFISAKCKNWLQNFKKLFNDDDLAVEIDTFPFFEFKGKRKEFNSPASWNGNELKNSIKTNLFLTPFYSGKHNIKFSSDQEPFLKEIKIFKLEFNNTKILNIPEDFLSSSERGKLFFDIAVKNVALSNFKVLAKCDTKDKLGLKINGKIAENADSKKYKNWYWLGAQLKGKSKELSKQATPENNLNYLEFKGMGNPLIENIEFSFSEFDLNKWGKVAIYKDIEPSFEFANLRSSPDHNIDNIIAKISNGEKVKILEELIIGSYVGSLSYIWHKIRYKDYEGFVLSSYIEIEGQERDRIIEMIKQKAKKVGIDGNIVLALAGCEARYKVYACSEKNALGIFQITEALKEDLNDETKPFYSPVENLFDFEKNIAAGISYFKYLYDKVYAKSKNKMIRAVAAYNTGPGQVPVKGDIDLKLYEEQTKRLATCVPQVYSSKQWYNIPYIKLPVIIIIFAFATFGANYLFNNGGIKSDLLYMADLSIQSNGVMRNEVNKYNAWYYEKLENQGRVALDEKTNEVIFFDDNKNIIYQIPVENLKIDETMKTSPYDLKEKWRVLIEKLAQKNNKIYFSATNSGYCGSAGCTQIIYELDLNTKNLRVIKAKIFGGIELFISPNDSKVALIYYPGSANGCGDFTFEIINLKTLDSRKIENFIDKKNPDKALESLLWRNDKEIEFSVIQWACSVSSDRFKRAFDYNLETGEIFIKKEEIRQGAG